MCRLSTGQDTVSQAHGLTARVACQCRADGCLPVPSGGGVGAPHHDPSRPQTGSRLPPWRTAQALTENRPARSRAGRQPGPPRPQPELRRGGGCWPRRGAARRGASPLAGSRPARVSEGRRPRGRWAVLWAGHSPAQGSLGHILGRDIFRAGPCSAMCFGLGRVPGRDDSRLGHFLGSAVFRAWSRAIFRAGTSSGPGRAGPNCTRMGLRHA